MKDLLEGVDEIKKVDTTTYLITNLKNCLEKMQNKIYDNQKSKF